MIGDRLLANLTGTPVNRKGLQSFEVAYVAKGVEGRLVILTDDRNQAGTQIRKTLFAEVPEATDYTFREFGYRSAQIGNLVDSIVGLTVAFQRQDKCDY
jgi:hypothetical protein